MDDHASSIDGTLKRRRDDRDSRELEAMELEETIAAMRSHIGMLTDKLDITRSKKLDHELEIMNSIKKILDQDSDKPVFIMGDDGSAGHVIMRMVLDRSDSKIRLDKILEVTDDECYVCEDGLHPDDRPLDVPSDDLVEWKFVTSELFLFARALQARFCGVLRGGHISVHHFVEKVPATPDVLLTPVLQTVTPLPLFYEDCEKRCTANATEAYHPSVLSSDCVITHICPVYVLVHSDYAKTYDVRYIREKTA